MIKVGILGDIGSGKSFVAKQFGYPVFNADKEVSDIYKNDKFCYNKIKNKFPKFIKSKILKKTFNEIEIIKWGTITDFDMIINATSLGLKNDENIILDYSKIISEKFFYDVIYNPSETNFLKSAKKNGNKIENGKKMFVYQAQASFKIWNNLEPKVDYKVMELLN